MPPKKLSKMTGMPQMGAAFSGWQSRVTLTRITQEVVDGLVTDTGRNITFDGTVQPLKPEMLALKPEGMRSWRWLQIHCLTSPDNLSTNDIIVYDGARFKVMDKLDYGLNNYVEYHLVADYEQAD